MCLNVSYLQRKTEFAQLFQRVLLVSAASSVQMTKNVLESKSVVQMDVDTPALTLQYLVRRYSSFISYFNAL